MLNPTSDEAEVLRKIEVVAGQAAARAAEIDEARVLPRDLHEALLDSGVFHAFAPREYGGLDMSLGTMNQIIFAGSRANGSLGWLLMVGAAQGPGFGLLPRPTALRLLERSPPPTIRGTIAPKGVAVPTDGGYLVSGQWPFASGGPDPDFVAGNCLVRRDAAAADGVPDALICLLPTDQAEFLDTWHVLGMRGTDSRDIAFRDVFVPADMAYNVFRTKSFFDCPHARLPLRLAYAIAHTAVALGIAQGALDDIIALSRTKRPSMNPRIPLSEDPVFRHALGENILRVASGQAMMNELTGHCETRVAGGASLEPFEIVRARSMGAFVTAECVKVVDWAYTASGSHGVFDSSSLQRRFRDIHVATQHAAVHTDGYRLVAAAALGDELSPLELF